MLVTVFAKKGKNCATAVSTAVALRIIPAERYHTVKNIQEELEILNNVHIFVRQHVLMY
jgi:hypothetical protein